MTRPFKLLQACGIIFVKDIHIRLLPDTIVHTTIGKEYNYWKKSWEHDVKSHT